MARDNMNACYLLIFDNLSISSFECQEAKYTSFKFPINIYKFIAELEEDRCAQIDGENVNEWKEKISFWPSTFYAEKHDIQS